MKEEIIDEKTKEQPLDPQKIWNHIVTTYHETAQEVIGKVPSEKKTCSNKEIQELSSKQNK